MSDYVTGNQLDYKLGRIGNAINPAAIRALVTGLSAPTPACWRIPPSTTTA
jgi:hypothetical protein